MLLYSKWYVSKYTIKLYKGLVYEAINITNLRPLEQNEALKLIKIILNLYKSQNSKLGQILKRVKSFTISLNLMT